MAKTTRVGELVTAYPHAYYPEDSWQDDMEFGAVELALAARALHDRRAAGWLQAATHWARAYLGSEHRDALNLYDTSTLAHSDLVRALRRSSRTSGFEVEVGDLVADLRRPLDSGGEGTVFPHCPQHQVANLAGSLTGGRDVLVGAVVNGPNGAENFEDIGIPDGARACPVDGVNRFAAFDRSDARFLDDVRAWPSVEPAIDFTSTGMLAFGLEVGSGGRSWSAAGPDPDAPRHEHRLGSAWRRLPLAPGTDDAFDVEGHQVQRRTGGRLAVALQDLAVDRGQDPPHLGLRPGP